MHAIKRLIIRETVRQCKIRNTFVCWQANFRSSLLTHREHKQSPVHGCWRFQESTDPHTYIH